MFEELIKSSMIFDNIDKRGFHNFKCRLCNDYKVRAGFIFDMGHIGYNCWNCGHKAKYTDNSEKMSKAFREVLYSIGITKEIIQHNMFSLFINPSETNVIQNIETELQTQLSPIALPEFSELLDGKKDDQDNIINYLVDRGMQFNYQYYYNTSEDFKDRVIIPFYRQGKIVFWQARSILKNEKQRFKNAPIDREGILFNFDELYKNEKKPLFVCEGVFDAMSCDGIAILGSSVTKTQLHHFSKSNRRLVFVIDKDSNGLHLAEKALQMGYEITYSPDATIDVNNSVKRYGSIYTIKHLMQNIGEDENTITKIKLSMKGLK